MKSTAIADNRKKGNTVLAIVIALTFVVTILFWVAIQEFQLSGLPLYFSQLGLYAIFSC